MEDLIDGLVKNRQVHIQFVEQLTNHMLIRCQKPFEQMHILDGLMLMRLRNFLCLLYRLLRFYSELIEIHLIKFSIFHQKQLQTPYFPKSGNFVTIRNLRTGNMA